MLAPEMKSGPVVLFQFRYALVWCNREGRAALQVTDERQPKGKGESKTQRGRVHKQESRESPEEHNKVESFRERITLKEGMERAPWLSNGARLGCGKWKAVGEG